MALRPGRWFSLVGLGAVLFGGLLGDARAEAPALVLVEHAGLGAASHCAARDASLCLTLDQRGLDAHALLSSVALRAEYLAPAAQQARTPPPVTRTPRAVGRQFDLGQGRELSVQLTPTPKRCAPLVKLTF